MLSADARRNMRLCIWIERLWPIFFGSSVIVKFYEDRHIDAGQVFIIQSLYSYCMVAFDVPSGHMAMRYGIKIMIIVGSIIQCVRAGVFVVSTEFWQFILVAVLTALGWSFVSGTTNAMMAEQLTPDKDAGKDAPNPYEDEYLPARADAQVFGSFIGVPVGAVMVWAGGTIMPFALQPLTFLAALVLAYYLHEQERVKVRAAHPAWREIKDNLRDMLWTNAHARWLVILGAIMSTALMSFTWLVQPKLLNQGVTANELVWLYTAQGTFGLLIGEFRRRRAKRAAKKDPQKPKRELWPYEAFAVLITVVGIMGSLAGASSGWPGVVAVLAAPILLRSFADRLQSTLLNRILPNKEKRAVEFSIVSAANNLTFAVVGTVMGFTLGKDVGAALHIVAVGMMCLGSLTLFIAYSAAKGKSK